VKNVRGAGVMQGFDVARSDLRDALRDRAFRRGLLMLPAGDRVLRFYPRFDTEPYVIDEALGILRQAVEDVIGGRVPVTELQGPKFRVGTLECPLEAIEVLDFTPAVFAAHANAVAAVEAERYGDVSQYPAGVLKDGRRPLLQYPLEALENTLNNPQSLGLALRDGVSGRIVAYALGSPIENHDEEGVSGDPHLGEGNTFYLQAMATLPSVQNQVELENRLLELVRERAVAAGFQYLSTLIEARVFAPGPQWLRDSQVLQVLDNYLGSGMRFLYAQVTFPPSPVATS